MTQDMAIQVGREALFMVMLVAAPMLGLGLIVGVVVSIFQANPDSGTDIGFCPENYRHFCGDSPIWTMDFGNAGGLYPGNLNFL